MKNTTLFVIFNVVVSFVIASLLANFMFDIKIWTDFSGNFFAFQGLFIDIYLILLIFEFIVININDHTKTIATDNNYDDDDEYYDVD